MCGMTPPYIEHDDPADDSTYLDMPRDEWTEAGYSDDDVREFYDTHVRPSTAPHADLERRVAQIEGDIEALTLRGTNLLKSIDYADERIEKLEKALFERTDRLAGSLAHLAMSVSEMRAPRLSLIQRVKVKLGRPIF